APADVDRAVADGGHDLVGHLVRLAHGHAGQVHVQAGADHGGGAGHPEDDLHHVYAVLAHLEPQALDEHAAERLGGGVDAHVGVAEVAGHGAHDHDSALATGLEAGAEAADDLHRRGDVEVDDLLHLCHVGLDEL